MIFVLNHLLFSFHYRFLCIFELKKCFKLCSRLMRSLFVSHLFLVYVLSLYLLERLKPETNVTFLEYCLASLICHRITRPERTQSRCCFIVVTKYLQILFHSNGLKQPFIHFASHYFANISKPVNK